MRQLILIVFVALTPLILDAQEYRITGNVVDSLTGEPLIGAIVHISFQYDSSRTNFVGGAATDVNGEFVAIIKSIRQPQSFSLRAICIGYKAFQSAKLEFRPGETKRYYGKISLEMDERSKRIWQEYKARIWWPDIDFRTRRRHINFRSVLTHKEIIHMP